MVVFVFDVMKSGIDKVWEGEMSFLCFDIFLFGEGESLFLFVFFFIFNFFVLLFEWISWVGC